MDQTQVVSSGSPPQSPPEDLASETTLSELQYEEWTANDVKVFLTKQGVDTEAVDNIYEFSQSKLSILFCTSL